MNTDKVKIKVKGRNIERFIRRLHSNNIDMLEIKYLKNNIVFLVIYLVDLKKVNKLKSIYEIRVIKYYGMKNIMLLIYRFKILLISSFIVFILLMICMNIITSVEVIHSDSDIRNLLYTELEKYGISRFNFKKDYNALEEISKKIIDKYKDKIEWMEIENSGTKYIIKVEERVINEKVEANEKVNIIASKTGIIKRVEASSGTIVKNTNSFVSKGDIVISGEIYLNDELKSITSAIGSVYAEVWYKTSVEVPYIYYDEKRTGNNSSNYRINFLNTKIDLFVDESYSKVDIEEEIILSHSLLPISFTKVNVEEVEISNEIYTINDAISVAKEKSITSIENKLDNDEYIISSKELKVSVKDSKIVMDMFFTVYENITEEIIIDENKLLTKNEQIVE